MTESKTAEQIQELIDRETKLMDIHQKNGKYAQAETCRLNIQQFRKDLEHRNIYDMTQRHKRQQHDLEKAYKDELNEFHNLFDKKISELKESESKSVHDLQEKQNEECSKMRSDLQINLCPKLKQSSELLNLRKMEEHMVKQKNFAEAHKVQQQINGMQTHQTGAWNEMRNIKIDTAISTLRNKQNVEMNNLKSKYKNLCDEQTSDKISEDDRLLKKFMNNMKDLKSQHDKEVLNHKGQFRSKGGKDSPMRTKSSFTA